MPIHPLRAGLNPIVAGAAAVGAFASIPLVLLFGARVRAAIMLWTTFTTLVAAGVLAVVHP